MELHAVRRLAVLDGARERHAVRRLADDEGTRRRDVAMREVEVSARRYAFEQGAFLKPVREELGNAQSLRQSCSLGQPAGLSGSCGTRLVGTTPQRRYGNLVVTVAALRFSGKSPRDMLNFGADRRLPSSLG